MNNIAFCIYIPLYKALVKNKVTQVNLYLRCVAKDDVGRDPEHNVRSRVVVNVPENKSKKYN